jgi:hypothetical protein
MSLSSAGEQPLAAFLSRVGDPLQPELDRREQLGAVDRQQGNGLASRPGLPS